MNHQQGMFLLRPAQDQLVMPGCCLPYFGLQGHMKIQMTTALDVFLKFCSWALLAVSSNGTPHYSHAALALEGEIPSCAGSDEIGTADGDEPGYLMLQNASESICPLISTHNCSPSVPFSILQDCITPSPIRPLCC